MEDEQTGAALCVQPAVQDLWVSDNSIFFGLLQQCVRVGGAFGLHRVAAGT